MRAQRYFLPALGNPDALTFPGLGDGAAPRTRPVLPNPGFASHWMYCTAHGSWGQEWLERILRHNGPNCGLSDTPRVFANPGFAVTRRRSGGLRGACGEVPLRLRAVAPPSVSIILPIYNEHETIDSVLTSLLAQDYPGPLEIVVADGGSDDGTRELLAAWVERDDRVRLVDNRHRVQSLGLNAAAAAATGEYLVRMDARTRYAPDYLRRSIETLIETGAAAAGGPMRPEGGRPFERAVAAAMRSPLTMGPGRFHHATERREVDTVYLGAFRREAVP